MWQLCGQYSGPVDNVLLTTLFLSVFLVSRKCLVFGQSFNEVLVFGQSFNEVLVLVVV